MPYYVQNSLLHAKQYYHQFFHHFIAGVFISRGKEDALVTKNLVPGDTVYGEKKIIVEVPSNSHFCSLLLICVACYKNQQ